MLEKRTDLKGRAANLDVSKFIRPDMALRTLDAHFPARSGVCAPAGPTMNERLLAATADAVDAGQSASVLFRVRNGDRSVGATLAGRVAKLYGREGMPNNQVIHARFEGEAGQSFGAWCVSGLELELLGTAQDGVAKGISGGRVVVTLDYTDAPANGAPLSVAGNNIAYGATGGHVFIGGRAGHRLGIRNSGATVVAEAAGKYTCEYMTRGRVLILGAIENEIGSGMTGGELFVFDPRNEAPAKVHAKSVTVLDARAEDYEWIHPLIAQYRARTGSRAAESILKNWQDVRRSRRLRKVVPLAVARAAEDFRTVGTNAG